MSSLSGGIQVFYLNMEESKGKDFSFPSGVAQKIVTICLSQKNWPPNPHTMLAPGMVVEGGGGMLKLWSNQLI